MSHTAVVVLASAHKQRLQSLRKDAFVRFKAARCLLTAARAATSCRNPDAIPRSFRTAVEATRGIKQAAHQIQGDIKFMPMTSWQVRRSHELRQQQQDVLATERLQAVKASVSCLGPSCAAKSQIRCIFLQVEAC